MGLHFYHKGKPCLWGTRDTPREREGLGQVESDSPWPQWWSGIWDPEPFGPLERCVLIPVLSAGAGQRSCKYSPPIFEASGCVLSCVKAEGGYLVSFLITLYLILKLFVYRCMNVHLHVCLHTPYVHCS